MTRQTSIDVYRRIEAEGLLSIKRWLVYSTLFQHGPLTATEIASHIPGYKSPSVGGNIHARLSELREMTAVYEVGVATCGVSGNTVIMWDVTGNMPVEREKKPTKAEIIASLQASLQRAEHVLEAAASVVSEEGVVEHLSCYVMGGAFLDRLDAWRKGKT